MFEVCRRSEGNPLYLKLLCDQIYEDGGMVESVDKIPESWADLYASTLKRISQQQGGWVALNILRILAVAKDALSVNMIRMILNKIIKMHVDTQEVINSVDLCRELLFEDETKENVIKYRIFHDSLRSWLKAIYKNECSEINNLIIEYVSSWESIDDEGCLDYVLKYGAFNIFDHTNWRNII